MSDYDLVSVDWNTVRLLQAGQFMQETAYVEERLRWLLDHGRFQGVLRMQADSVARPIPIVGQENTYTVRVQGLFGVAKQGSLIHIPAGTGHTLERRIRVPTTGGALYIGVALTEREKEPEIKPAVDRGLLNCGGRRALYRLASEDLDADTDWLQIAELYPTAEGLSVRGEPSNDCEHHPKCGYLPECVFVDSHPALQQQVVALGILVAEVQQALVPTSTESVELGVYAMTAAFQASLGGAAIAPPPNTQPRAYLAQLVGILSAQRMLLQNLPIKNRGSHAERLIASLLVDDLHTNGALGTLFCQVRRCFEALKEFFPQMVESLNGYVPSTRIAADIFGPTRPAPPPEQKPAHSAAGNATAKPSFTRNRQ